MVSCLRVLDSIVNSSPILRGDWNAEAAHNAENRNQDSKVIEDRSNVIVKKAVLDRDVRVT